MQTKDTLTLRASAFGSKCELPEKYLKRVADAGVLEAVSQFAKFKEDRLLKKGDGAKRSRLTGAGLQPGADSVKGTLPCKGHVSAGAPGRK